MQNANLQKSHSPCSAETRIRVFRVLLLATVFALIALAQMALTPSEALAADPHGVFTTQSGRCGLCHVSHEASPKSTDILKSVGEGRQSDICIVCHDGTGASSNVFTGPDSFSKMSGHTIEERVDGQTDLTNSCSSCHSPHEDVAKRPNLPSRSINGTSVAGQGNQWCFSCHDDKDSWVASGYPGVEKPSYDETGYPVRGTFPGRTTYSDPTRNAHAQLATTSPEQTRGDCRLCHASHRGNGTYDGLKADFRPSTTSTVLADRTTGAYAGSCFACHDGNATWKDRGAVDIKSIVTNDGADDSSFAGHRIKTSGAKMPKNSPLPCYECHNPHGSKNGNRSLLADNRGRSIDTSKPADVRKFCLGCHSTVDGKMWNETASAYTTASATATVAGLRVDGTLLPGQTAPNTAYTHNWLKLRRVFGGHESDATESCYTCHGSDYSRPNSANVHNPNGGTSNGGTDCYDCHGIYQRYMEDDTGAKTGDRNKEAYHHVMGAADGSRDGDYAPGATATYPNSTQDVLCTSCHVDHDKFNANKGANLRRRLGNTAGTDAVNTDFVPSGSASTGYGICVECHSMVRTVDTTNQAPGVDTQQPLIRGAQFAAAFHSYSVSTTYGASPFEARCSKCHDDELPASFQTREIGTHYTFEKHLLAALGETSTPEAESHESGCFKCHKGRTAGKDGYGVADMGAFARSMEYVYTDPSFGSTHPVGKSDTGRVECASCHNVHYTPRSDRAVNPDNTYTVRRFTSATAVNGYCLTCHDGAPPVKASTPTTYVPYTVEMKRSQVNQSTYISRSHTTVNGSMAAGSVKSCKSCHDNHASKADSLLGVYDVATDKNYIQKNGTSPRVEITANDNKVCYTCHDTAGTGYAPATPTLASMQTAEGYRDAAGYFAPAPVAGSVTTMRWPGQAAWTNLATSKHFTSAKSYDGKKVGDCKTCHDVHGTANAYDQIVSEDGASSYTDGNFRLCLKCHNGTVGTTNIARYYKPANGGTGGYTANSGHVVKTAVPGARLQPGDPIPCYDCHNPHGSANGNSALLSDQRWSNLGLTKSDPAASRKLCLGCHVTSDGRDGNGTTLTASDTNNTFEGIPRRPATAAYANRLLLPGNTTAHANASTQACYDCHGRDYSGDRSLNVHNPGVGPSNGGVTCYACHSGYQAYMEDGAGTKTGASRTSSYHHVLGGAAGDGDIAPAPGAFPQSQQDVYCVSCHTDHNSFNSNRASNLRESITSSGLASADSDYLTTGSNGICVSCHATSQAKDTANRKNDGTTSTPKILGGTGAGAFGASAHSYDTTSAYADSSEFRANCSKCHNDEQPEQYQTTSKTFGTHWSSTRRMISALGGQQVDPLQEQHCYRCHSKSGDGVGGTAKNAPGKDWYGNTSMLTPGTEDVYRQFQLVSKHPVGGSPSGSVECGSCHNVHAVSASSPVSDPDNTYNAAAYSTPADKTQFCMKCHDGGTLPTARQDGTAYVPENVTIAPVDQTIMNKNQYGSRGHWSANGSIDASETKDCAVCHDQHGSTAPKLLGTYDPATGTNRIGSKTLTANDSTACYACHTNATAGASRTESGYPMEGRWPGQGVYAGANGIHSGSTVVRPGTAYAGGDCKNCHDVHGTANPFDEIKGSYTSARFDACFECHDGSPSAKDVKQYYPASAGGTNADTSRAGHATKTKGNLPAGSALPCYDCHNPHGSGSADGLSIVTQTSVGTTVTVGDTVGEIDMTSGAGVRNFCLACHTTSDTQKGWNGSALEAVGAGATFEGIDRTSASAVLRLPVVNGHRETDGQSCYTCHGNSYGMGGNNVHYPSGGVSGGGSECYKCHAQYQAMEDGAGAKVGANRTDSFHHVLGGAEGDGDIAPNTGAYPTSENDVYCVSCHSDHNNFNSNKGANLRTGIARPGSETTNSDFTQEAPYGVCVSCHTIGKDKDTANQKSGGSTSTPAIDGSEYSASAHDFDATSSFSGGSTFRANCSKCHNDEQAKSFQVSTYRFGTHFSADRRLLAAMGVNVPASGQTEETACYKCHSATSNPNSAAGRDFYNAFPMSARARDIQAAMGQAYSHVTSATSGAHRSDETSSSIWGPGRHVECEDCHDAHRSRAGTRTAGSSVVAPAMRGARGVNPTWSSTNWTPATSFATTTLAGGAGDYEAYNCFRCHTSYGGSVTGTTTSGIARTDLALEFNPANQSGHNVMGSRTVWPKTTTAQGLPYSWSFPTNAFVTTRIPNMSVNYKVTCTDCHTNDSTAGAKGPHGSSSKFMVASGGANEWWKTTLGGWTTTSTMLCARCHNKGSNNVHNDGNHSNYSCDMCHVRVPHGYKRPRLLQRYGTDPAPYASTNTGALRAIRGRAYTPTGWQKSDCQAGCAGDHSAAPSPIWP